MRTILTVLLAVAALCSAETGRRAPGFSLRDSNGQQRDLADYRGKIVVLEFMQTTCPHCAGFTPVLQQVQQKYGDKVAILAIAVPSDTPATVAQYVAGHKITYPVMLECGQVAYSYVRTGNIAFPHVYVVDANGMIQGDWEYGPLTQGVFEGPALMAEIDRLLGAAGTKKK